jgi:hypothetical protein
VTIPTRRTLWILAALSPLAIAGYLTQLALGALLLLDTALVLLVWLDSRLAVDPYGLDVERVSPVGFIEGVVSVAQPHAAGREDTDS